MMLLALEDAFLPGIHRDAEVHSGVSMLSRCVPICHVNPSNLPVHQRLVAGRRFSRVKYMSEFYAHPLRIVFNSATWACVCKLSLYLQEQDHMHVYTNRWSLSGSND